MQVNVVFEADPVVRALRELPAALDATQPGTMQSGYQRAADILLSWEANRFASAAAHDGTWQDHADSTKEERGRRQGVPAKQARTMSFLLLHENGSLADALFTRGANGHFEDFYPDGIDVGARGKLGMIAATQHYGSTKRNIPARTIYVDPPQDVQARMWEAVTTAVRTTWGAVFAKYG